MTSFFKITTSFVNRHKLLAHFKHIKQFPLLAYHYQKKKKTY